MQRQSVLALVLVALLGVAAVGATAAVVGAATTAATPDTASTTSTAGTAATADPGPGDDVTVEGTVTGIDGDPASDAVVLIGDEAMLTKLTPEELRDVAADDPRDLTVVEVERDGAFETTVAWKRADGAVALSDDGISEVASIGHRNATLSMALHERRPQTVHTAAGAVSADEHQVQVYVSLVNNDDWTVRTLSLAVTALPEGWAIADVETAGTFHPDDRTLTWASVEPGAEVDTTIVLTVPEDTPVGEYEVGVRADSDTHLVDADAVTVETLPAETAAPTTTSSPGDDGGTPTAGDDAASSPATTSTTGAGFSIGVALVALALATAGLARRR